MMHGVMEEQNAALLALVAHRPDGMTVRELMTEVLATEDAVALWESWTSPDLFGDSNELEVAREELGAWAREGLTFTSILDPRYPARLRGVFDAPAFLFYRGDLAVAEGGVSVVGSRDASPRACDRAATIAELVVARGLPVISGLARGIDAAAHEAVIAAGGRPVGVIATGIAGPYTPADSRGLHDRVAEKGVLVSQFRPRAHAQKHTFLMRNATMSGLGIATIVVEAGEHSGARAQARLAMEHGRPVLLTQSVVDSTRWGRDLADGSRPNVFPVSGLDDVTAALDRIAWTSSHSIFDRVLATT